MHSLLSVGCRTSSGLTAPAVPDGDDARLWMAAILRASPDAIIGLATDTGRITFWSPAAARLFGYTEEEAVGASGTLLMSDLNCDAAAPELTCALTGEPVHFEAFRRAKDGRTLRVAITAACVPAPGGNVLGVMVIARDVTRQPDIQERLAVSEVRLQGIVDSIDQMIWSTRPDGYHDYYNQRWYEFTGAPPGSTDGEDWNGMFHPDDQERAWSVWRHSLVTGTPYHIEYRLRHHSGQYRWVIGRAQPVRDASGQITRWYGTCTDVHDFKLAEEALRTSEERFRLALEAAGGIGTWAWDFARNEVRVDAACAALFDLDVEQAVKGLPVDMFIAAMHPDDRARVAAEIGRALERGTEYQAEYRVVGASGVVRWVLARGRCVHDSEGRPQRFPGIILDITDRVRTEEALRTAVERIELALDSGTVIGTWVWEIGADRFIADERFARSFGLDPELCRDGLPLRTVARSIHPDDWPETERRINAALEQGGPYRAEYRVRQADGTYRWVEANGRCELDGKGCPYRFPGVLIDIEPRKHVEDELRHRETEARETSRLLRAVIEAIPALVYVKDREGRMRIANRPALDLIGKPWSAVEGCTDLEFLDDAEQARRIMEADRRIMETGVSESLEEIVGSDERGPRVWLSHKAAFHDEEGKVVGLVGNSAEITARQRAEEARRILLRELNHRVKNLFSVAIGMVSMTARTAHDVTSMSQALNGRLLALARAHDLIRPAVTGEAEGRETTTLSDLVKAVLTPHLTSGEEQVQIEGPAVSIAADAATSLALALHELATNAVKYGALSVSEGRLLVSWRCTDDDLMLAWTESGGPQVLACPERQGFGSRLTRMSVNGQLGGTILYKWNRPGLAVTLSVPKRRLES